tara:strand:+ start:1458 stop:1754 length:297 start_codon:yes stop_codon:yes gene_type:complete
MAKYRITDNFRGLYQTFTTYQRTQNTVKKNYGGTDFDKDVTIPPNSGLDSTEVTTFGITRSIVTNDYLPVGTGILDYITPSGDGTPGYVQGSAGPPSG